MKTSQFVSFLRSLIVASSLVVALQQAPAATPRGAQVQSVSGGATYTIPGQPPVSIQPGAIIPEGATINTPPGATVDLFLGRGAGVVRVTGDSSVRIDSLETTETGSETITRTLLTLERGEVLGRVNKLSQASNFQIRLPDGVLQVGESEFQLVQRSIPGLIQPGLADGIASTDNGTAPITSSIRFLSGTGNFTTGEGRQHSFNGASQITPTMPTPVSIPTQETAALRATLRSMDANNDGKPDSGGAFVNNLTALARETSRPLQTELSQLPLSPTIGGQ